MDLHVAHLHFIKSTGTNYFQHIPCETPERKKKGFQHCFFTYFEVNFKRNDTGRTFRIDNFLITPTINQVI